MEPHPMGSLDFGEYLMEVRGKNLYMETAGAKDLPVVVYLHGGPGASCFDFVAVQMPRLAKYFYVVTFDQRGVLRSDPIDADEAFGMEDLVADCEALRRQLGIEEWSVLGHSFGGHLGVRYATTHPRSIRALVLECPSFDLAQSLRSHLRAMGWEWLQTGDIAKSIQAWAVALRGRTTEELLAEFQLLQADFGGTRWEALHIHGPNKDFPAPLGQCTFACWVMGTVGRAFRTSIAREPDQRVARTVTGSDYAAHASHQRQA